MHADASRQIEIFHGVVVGKLEKADGETRDGYEHTERESL